MPDDSHCVQPRRGQKYLLVKQISSLSWKNISGAGAITWLNPAITYWLGRVNLWAIVEEDSRRNNGCSKSNGGHKVHNYLNDFQVFLMIKIWIYCSQGVPLLPEQCLCIIFMFICMISILTMVLCMYFRTVGRCHWTTQWQHIIVKGARGKETQINIPLQQDSVYQNWI